MIANIKLIVGLANPGTQYAKTRHNAGDWVIEQFAHSHQATFKVDKSYFGKTAKIQINNQAIHLLIPTTFMNLSGKSVSAFARFYQIQPEEILVIHDELDLPVGRAKFKQGGGHGGHNGLRDIINKLGNNKQFFRLRIGIDHPGHKDQVANYVLNAPSKSEKVLLDQTIDEATRCLDLLFKENLAVAQNRLHTFKPT